MANTNKKTNTTNIEWPTGHFTIEDIQNKYPDVVNITLRFRVKKAVENKEIVTVGKIKPAIGRPKIVFARANPSSELLNAAKAAGVIFNDEPKSAITVAEVKAEKKVKTVVPTIPSNSQAVPAVSS
jgi:hypothetical protein